MGLPCSRSTKSVPYSPILSVTDTEFRFTNWDTAGEFISPSQNVPSSCFSTHMSRGEQKPFSNSPAVSNGRENPVPLHLKVLYQRVHI
jgi:hypothetical protein